MNKTHYYSMVLKILQDEETLKKKQWQLWQRSFYTFKNANKTFNLKGHFTCDSSNILYITICPTCGEEYTGETGAGKTKLRDRVRVYWQHIRQPEYQKLKVEEHLRTCGKGTFKIFPLLQIWSSEIDLRASYEKNFMKKYKTKLSNL